MDYPLMQTTPGITVPNLTKEPLGTEGELTVGPDEANPYRSLDEKEIVEDYKERLRKDRSENPTLVKVPFESPTKGDDPFAFPSSDMELLHGSKPSFDGFADRPQF